jgi:glycosyltransferase involved in cell wall biosynthesis
LGSLNPCKNISDNARRFDDFCFPRKHNNSQVPLFENYAFKQFFSRDRIIEIAKFSGLDFFVGEENILTNSDPDTTYFFEKFVKCVEFRKPRIEEIPIEPLVSICIPAHKSEFLRETLVSIQGQDYENIEILVSDDSEDSQIFDIVDSFKDSRVRYLVPPIKEAHCNHIHPAQKSSGYFVKFCNDDDLLSRSAVRKLVGLASLNPAATLISSARRQIDRSGNLLPLSSGVFQPISKRPMLIDGQYASLLAIKFGNFIGEPNCTLFKKADFEIFGEQIFNICGDSSSLIFGTPADLQMWFNFLSRGDLVYTPEVLSYLRVHESAISFSHKTKPQEAKLGWKNFVDNATKYGFNLHSEPRFHEIA